MARKIIQEDLSILREMYSQAGKLEHFEKHIATGIKSQDDLEDAVKNSFGDLNTRSQFTGVLQQNEFVEQFYNIYRQRVLTMLSGEIPYIKAFLKEAPFSGSQGYISQNIKAGKDFTFTFSEGTFNPERRPAYLQVISTKIERQYADEISITVIGRAASKEGGLNKYMNDRIGLLEEDFVAEIRVSILASLATVQGKVLTITIPAELQSYTMREQKARLILESIISELKNMKDNSEEYSDNGFTTRKALGELTAAWTRKASAEMLVQAQGMLRNPKVMNEISVGNMFDVPNDTFEEGVYAKFMTRDKIHYSNSVSVSGIDVINANMKGVYTKTVFTELDIIDTEPALTVKVVDAPEGAKLKATDLITTAVEKDIAKRTKAAKIRRLKLYETIEKFYKAQNAKNAKKDSKTTAPKVVKAPIDVVTDEETAESTEE